MTDWPAEHALIQRAPGVLERRLLDGVVVLAPGAAEPVRIITPGQVLWAMLAEPCTIADLADVWSTLSGASDGAARAVIEPVLRAWHQGQALIIIGEQTGPWSPGILLPS